jgi:lysozyme family protein
MSDLTSEQALTKAFVFAQRWEGGYVNHPNDHGGATNLGVTQRVYDQYRLDNGQSRQSVRDITKQEAQAIYVQGYWNQVKGNQLSPLTSISLVDFAYNSGPSRAIHEMKRFLRENGYDIPMTGEGRDVRNEKLDSKTIEATKAYVSQYGDEKLAQGINTERRQFVQNIVDRNPDQKVFLKGWNNRINALEGYVRELSSEKVQSVQSVTSAPTHKSDMDRATNSLSATSAASQKFAQASQMILDQRGHLEGDTQVYRGYTYTFQKQADTLTAHKHGQEILKQVGNQVVVDRVTPSDVKVLHTVTQNLEKLEQQTKDFAKASQTILEKRGHSENETQVFKGNIYSFEKTGDTLTVQKQDREIFKQVGNQIVNSQVTAQDVGVLSSVAEALEDKETKVSQKMSQSQAPVGAGLER